MPVDSVKQFNSAIRQFQKADSDSGKKIGKAEVQKALKTLEGDGKVTAKETKAAKDLLQKGALTPGAADALQAFVERHEPRTSHNLKPALKSAVLSTFNADNTRGTVHWLASMPLGPQFHTEELMRETHTGGFAFSVMVQTGALNPTAPQIDPNQAKQFWIKRTGGFAGVTQYAGPFTMPKTTRGGALGLISARTGGDSGVRRGDRDSDSGIRRGGDSGLVRGGGGGGSGGYGGGYGGGGGRPS